MKNKLSLLLLGGALVFGSALTNKTVISTKASGTIPTHLPGEKRPTTINIEHLSDAEIFAYYDEAVNEKKGDDLLAGLYSKINNHREYSYDSAQDREIYKIIDRNWDLSPLPDTSGMISGFNYSTDNPFIHKLYADYNDSEETADLFKNEDATRVSFDKEHIWAQSLGGFGRDGGAGSDFHSLWPSDVIGNQQGHSNYNFGVPTSKVKEVLNDKGTVVGYNGYVPGWEHKVFEPLDEYKGDVARAMFYMVARYYEYGINKPKPELYPKLELVNGSPLARKADEDTTGQAGDLATLLEWNELDPVDEYEINRNNLIYNNYQGNRNPFIDYPQWARIAFEPLLNDEVEHRLHVSSVGSESDPYSDAEILSIDLIDDNVKKEYMRDEVFVYSGLKVRAHYSGGVNRIVKNFTTNIPSGEKLTTSGTHTITVFVEHNNKTVSENFTINVGASSLIDSLAITEVFGGGGNAGASYNYDYVELYNYSDERINLNGKSVQVAAATAKADGWYITALNGFINPKSYYLVQLNSQNVTVGTELPLGDVKGDRNFPRDKFKVGLVNKASALSWPKVLNENDELVDAEYFEPSEDDPYILDFVGVGTGANSANGYFGEAPTEIGHVDKSIQRRTDSNGKPLPKGEFSEYDNSKDFIRSSNMTPTNSALSVAHDIMAGNTIGQCEDLYEKIKPLVLNLSESVFEEQGENLVQIFEGQLDYFKTSMEELYVHADFNEGGRTVPTVADAHARYLAWAAYHGDAHPYEDASEEVGETPVNALVAAEMGYTLIIFLLVLTLAGYGLLQKRQTH